MKHSEEIRRALEYVDGNITAPLTAGDLAGAARFSPSHLSRLFRLETGLPPMAYVTRRKLQYALHQLGAGKTVTRVAMDYGFETHAGFTKAFRRHFGYPPSLARLHLGTAVPTIDDILIHGIGGLKMHPDIKNIEALSAVGYTSRHRMPDVRGIADIPAYWDDIGLDYGAELSTLHNTYTKSHHCEVAVCFDIDEEHGCFTYMLGVGVEAADAGVPQRPGTWRCDIPGGLYAVFRTPFVDEGQYIASIQQAWKDILIRWLPAAPYLYDDSRPPFEYYDENDHEWLHDGMQCMTIYIPVAPK